MKKHQEGSAMIVVMCVMIVTVALSLSLLLTASVLSTNATRSNNKEQCRISAVSMSDVLEKEITSFHYDGSEDGGVVAPIANASGKTSGLKGKLKTVATSAWYEYNPNAGVMESLQTNGKDYYTYEMKDGPIPGDFTVEMYWLNESGDDTSNLNTQVPETAVSVFNSVLLYVKVTCTMGEESSTIISTYQPNASYSTTGANTGDSLLDQKWDPWNWKFVEHDWERSE